MTDRIRDEKSARMRALYEREKEMRENAVLVIGPNDPRPKRTNLRDVNTGKWAYYVESATAAKLRAVFEDGVEPWW